MAVFIPIKGLLQSNSIQTNGRLQEWPTPGAPGRCWLKPEGQGLSAAEDPGKPIQLGKRYQIGSRTFTYHALIVLA
jgi:hypothetical protein